MTVIWGLEIGFWGLEIAFPASICRGNDRVIKKGNSRKSDFEAIFWRNWEKFESGVMFLFCSCFVLGGAYEMATL